ncbi:hypothetical protein [Streptomyces sp. NPDC088915]|uniref:hypothetical protein n=1 Tax=Streptomyces sp. NPDC088915 TaxID=3365912 RepID=UPI00381F39AD
MTVPLITVRNGVGPDWTAADYDSLLVLTELGVSRPAARVTRARRGRPLRRAVRAMLRTVLTTTGPVPLRATGRGLAR